MFFILDPTDSFSINNYCITLTTPVHCGRHDALIRKLGCFGGMAILSTYSRPSSITAASLALIFLVRYTLRPESSTQSKIKTNYNYLI